MECFEYPGRPTAAIDIVRRIEEAVLCDLREHPTVVAELLNIPVEDVDLSHAVVYSAVVITPEEAPDEELSFQYFHRDSTSDRVLNLLLALENNYKINVLHDRKVKELNIEVLNCLAFSWGNHQGVPTRSCRCHCRVELDGRGRGNKAEVYLCLIDVFSLQCVILLFDRMTGDKLKR